jgi:hypothetical protein
MRDDVLVERLDKLIAITQLVHKDAIDRARERIFGDAANRAILESSTDWVPAGRLQAGVMKATGQSQPTVKRRIADLVANGVLAKQGGGGNVSYKATGLI